MKADAMGPTVVAEELLGPQLWALFSELAHAGDISPVMPASNQERLICGEAGERNQGTQVRFQLLLHMPERRVLEARYRAFGCPYTLATCEWIARRLHGSTLAALSPQGLSEALGVPADWAEQLDVPADRLGRLLVVEDALHAALASAARGGACAAA